MDCGLEVPGGIFAEDGEVFAEVEAGAEFGDGGLTLADVGDG